MDYLQPFLFQRDFLVAKSIVDYESMRASVQHGAVLHISRFTRSDSCPKVLFLRIIVHIALPTYFIPNSYRLVEGVSMDRYETVISLSRCRD